MNRFEIEERLQPLIVWRLYEVVDLVALGCPFSLRRGNPGQIARVIKLRHNRFVGKIAHRHNGLELIGSGSKAIDPKDRDALARLVFKLHYFGQSFVTISRIFFDTQLIIWMKYGGHGRFVDL